MKQKEPITLMEPLLPSPLAVELQGLVLELSEAAAHLVLACPVFTILDIQRITGIRSTVISKGMKPGLQTCLSRREVPDRRHTAQCLV